MNRKKNKSIENSHNNILHKILLLKECFKIIINIECPEHVNKLRTYFMLLYDNINNDYELRTSSFLSKYYDKKYIKKYGVRDISYLYNNMINYYNNSLIRCIHFVIEFSKIYNIKKEDIIKINRIYNNFKKPNPSKGIIEIKYNICSCGDTMEIDSFNSELYCYKCGKTVFLYGSVFYDNGNYININNTKQGCYDPSRHCKIWVQRIQGKENIDIKKDCIDKIKKCLIRDKNTIKNNILCEHIRNYLKEIKYTEYNDNIPYIRKIIFNIEPPSLNIDELRKLYNLFDKSIDVFDDIKSSDKSNTMYYPYIIYKILDNILKPGMRKRKILECIHLQGRETLISNDNEWRKICKHIKHLKYKPTDRYDQIIYL